MYVSDENGKKYLYFNKHDFTNAYKTINDYAIQTEIEFALFLNSNKLGNWI